jgi:hypothetical protein
MACRVRLIGGRAWRWCHARHGSGFTWDDLFNKSALRDAADVPPTIETIYFQLALIGIFTVLSWYFDNTVPGSAHRLSHTCVVFSHARTHARTQSLVRG